jgi:hypothetical protein
MSKEHHQSIRDEKNILWKLKIGGHELTIARYLSIDHFSYLVMDREGNIQALGLTIENLHALTDGTQYYAHQVERAVWHVIPMEDLHHHISPVRELELSDYVNGIYSYKEKAEKIAAHYEAGDRYPDQAAPERPQNLGEILPGIFD